MSNQNLKQGTRIQFLDNNERIGTGTIFGLATTGSPIIGKKYIIEPDQKISNDVYDYTHVCAWEYMFKVI